MSLLKRGNRWYLRYTDNGRRVWRSLGPEIKTKRQAETLLKTLEMDRLSAKLSLINPGETTISQFQERFIDERTPHLSPQTIKRYRATFRILQSDLGDLLVGTLSSRVIGRWGRRSPEARRAPHRRQCRPPAC